MKHTLNDYLALLEQDNLTPPPPAVVMGGWMDAVTEVTDITL